MNIAKETGLQEVIIPEAELLKQKFEMMLDAWQKGEITVKKVLKYRKELPRVGNFIYRVQFMQPEILEKGAEPTTKVIYDGAYQLGSGVVAKLEKENKLIPFILFHLINELSF